MKEVKIEGLALYDHQKAVLNCFIKNQNETIIVVKSSRQKGKSLLIQQLALRQTINNENTVVIIVEPTYSQCKRMLKQIAKGIRKIPGLIESINSQDLILSFTNGSEIQLLSAASGDNLRGNTVTEKGFLCIDEAAFVSDEVIYNCFPFCDANKANIILVSTPKFKSGAFYDNYVLAVDGENGFKLIDFNNFDTSMLLSKERLEQYRKTLPPQIFRSEYLGEFIEETSDLFGDLKFVISNDYDISSPTEVIGVDWSSGTDGDYTVFTALNSLMQMNDIKIFNDLKPVDIVKKLVAMIKNHRPKKVIVESNSIGAVYLDVLKKELRKNKISVQIESFNTTNDSKRKIIENLQLKIQNREITILDNTELKIELVGFSILKTPGGKITYGGVGVHDDCVMSLAIALSHFSKPGYVVF